MQEGIPKVWRVLQQYRKSLAGYRDAQADMSKFLREQGQKVC